MTTTRRRRSSRGAFRGFRSGRKTQWVDTLVNASTANAGQSIVTLLSGLVGNDTEGMTLTRLIINLNTSLNTWTGNYGVQRLDMAIGMVSQEEFGASVVPDPSASLDEPVGGWAWRSEVHHVIPGSVSAAFIPSVIQADLSSKRKIGSGELLLIVDNNAISGGPDTVRLGGIIRALFLLP